MAQLAYLLWLQTGYAIWQFFRYTKFLRLPYIVLASFWNSGLKKSWFRKRRFVWIDCGQQPEFNTHKLECIEDEEKVKEKFEFYSDAVQTSFKIGSDTHTYTGASNFQLATLLTHYQDPYHVAHKMLPIYKDVYIIKCLPLQKALQMVVDGAEVYFKEEFCLVDDTTEDYLNENFLRIMSILPLSLQAKGFDVLSTYLSVALLVLDLFSVPANQLWQWFCTLFIRHIKMTLAHFPTWFRAPLHYVLSTGSQEFMFADMYRKKSYWSEPGDCLVKSGNRMDGWNLKDTLLQGGVPRQVELMDENRRGTFKICDQQVWYDISVEEDGKYHVRFDTPNGTVRLETYWVNDILYKISVFEKHPLKLPPINRLQGNVITSFTSIESYLQVMNSYPIYHLYSSPNEMICCS